MKTQHWHKLCRTRADYFRLWEEGRGPGQQSTGINNLAQCVACRQQGERIRNETCPSCRGTVRLKVFACTVHGECTLTRQLTGVACCRICEEYEPSETDSPD